MKTSNIAPRFFVEEGLDQEEILLTDENIIHQLQKVLRKKVDDQIILLDGKGTEFFGEIFEISKKEIIVKKVSIKKYEDENFYDEKFKSKKIILAPAILKKDNFELVVQKGTELGIKNFQPIVSERTEKENLNFERLEKISREASEQSEKIFLPKILQTKSLEEFLEEKSDSKIFALQFNKTKIDKNKILEIESELIFLVGPEGGWGESDLELFDKFNVEQVSLGQQILRAETASIALVSTLLL